MAVALPMTWEAFSHEARSERHDFAGSVVRGSGRSVAQAWDEVYRPSVVQTCARVAARVESLGGTLELNATEATLRMLIRHYPVVCVVAHLVPSRVVPDDVVDPDAVLRIISAGDSIVARCLGAILDQQKPLPTHDLQHAVAALLDDALKPTRTWCGAVVQRDQRSAPSPILTRPMLEDCLGKALRGARVLELRDGIHTTSELVDMIPLAFDGVLDLSVCNSFMLGESIKRWRRRCLVIENAYLARIDLRLARFALGLTLLAQRATRYTDMLRDLSLTLMGARR